MIQADDLVAEVHLDNLRVREVVGRDGWFGIRCARQDLAAIARWTATRAPGERPVALHASSLLAPLAVRAGFEIVPRPRTARTRLDDWFLRWLLARWSPDGRARLARGRGRLRSADVWLSADALVARYAPGPADGRSAAPGG